MKEKSHAIIFLIVLHFSIFLIGTDNFEQPTGEKTFKVNDKSCSLSGG